MDAEEKKIALKWFKHIILFHCFIKMFLLSLTQWVDHPEGNLEHLQASNGCLNDLNYHPHTAGVCGLLTSGWGPLIASHVPQFFLNARLPRLSTLTQIQSFRSQRPARTAVGEHSAGEDTTAVWLPPPTNHHVYPDPMRWRCWHETSSGPVWTCDPFDLVWF